MKATIRVTKIKSPDELRSSGAGSELAAFEAYRAKTGARQRKGAPLALRLSCGVLKRLGRAEGTRTNRSAQLPRPLSEQASEWAESWAGPGAVFFAGTSGKDGDRAELLVAPIRDSRGKPVISTQKALTELVRQTREITEYSALQASWASWCAAHIDSAIQRGARRVDAGADAKPERPVSSSFATIREAIGQADLSEDATERLGALLRLKIEVVRHKASGGDYTAPEAALRVWELHPPVGRPPAPWPFIEAIRAPALAVLTAAIVFSLGLDRDDPDYQDGIEHFPDLEDRIRLAIVVARCGLFCAQGVALGRGPDRIIRIFRGLSS